MKIAVVTVRAATGEAGGAERLYGAMVQAFNDLGHQAEEVSLWCSEATFEDILANYLHFYDLDLSKYDVVVSTKAPTWMVRHPRHVCYLIHTIRAFYDMYDLLFPNAGEALHQQRELIHYLDGKGLAAPHCKAVFSIGYEVTDRLRRWNGMDAPVLHPPLWDHSFRQGSSEPYLFLPGRLHRWKRIDLAIRAIKLCKSPLQLRVAGTGEDDAELRALAGDDSRVKFLGRVSEDALISGYQHAFAVPFTPKSEDYGYVTLEAFASGKPVVTCRDSGEAALIVGSCGGGVICDPSPEALAQAIDWLWDHRQEAGEMGRRGFEWVQAQKWSDVAGQLLAAA
jgi:glycosyltransferase involved in cell wall biosynthesis